MRSPSPPPPAEDARVARSREALRAALLEMLEREPLERIAIRDLARRAGVGHATFYRHYPTKEALLDDIAADEIRRLVSLTLPVLDRADSRAACAALTRYVAGRWQLWRVLLTGGAAAALKEELLAISRRVAAERPRPAHDLPEDLAVALAVAGIIELLAWWLRQEDPWPAEQVADLLDRAVVGPAARGRAPPRGEAAVGP